MKIVRGNLFPLTLNRRAGGTKLRLDACYFKIKEGSREMLPRYYILGGWWDKLKIIFHQNNKLI